MSEAVEAVDTLDHRNYATYFAWQQAVAGTVMPDPPPSRPRFDPARKMTDRELRAFAAGGLLKRAT